MFAAVAWPLAEIVDESFAESEDATQQSFDFLAETGGKMLPQIGGENDTWGNPAERREEHTKLDPTKTAMGGHGTFSLHCLGVALFVFFATLISWHGTFHGDWDFVWDDTENFGDAMLQRLRWSWANLHWWSTSTVLRVYEPVALAFKATAFEVMEVPTAQNLHELAGISHSICVSLAFVGTKLMSGTDAEDGWHFFGRLCFSAILFGVHPLCVQTVCWVSCLPYIWAAILCWFSFIFFHLSLDQSSFLRAACWTCLSAMASFGAMMCKAASLLWPMVLILYRRCVSGNKEGNKSRQHVLPFLFDVLQCLAVLVGTFLAFNALRDGTEGEKQMSQVQLEVHDNVLRAGMAVFLYFWRFFQVCLGTASSLPFKPVERNNLSSFERVMGVFSLLLIAALTLGSLLVLHGQKSRFRTAVSFWWISYLMILLPCLQLFQHGDPLWFTDRYAYLPLALLLPPAVSLMLRCMTPRWSYAMMAMMGPIVLVLSYRSNITCDCWRNGVVLWSAAAQELDWHVFHHQLGVSSLAAGNLTTAQHALDRAWQQRPDALTAKAMAKVLAAQGGRPNKSLQWLRKALDLAESTGMSSVQAAATYHDMAVLHSRLKTPDLAKIIKLYQESLQLAPDRALTQESLGLTLAVARRHQEALIHLREAQRLGLG
eukprot:symbB.v1.2.023565.t1/scaffold2165.1/size87246/2